MAAPLTRLILTGLRLIRLPGARLIRRGLIRLRDPHLLPRLERVRGINYDPVVHVEAAQNFQRCPVVLPDRDRAQLHLIIVANHADLRPLGAKQHRIYRDRDALYRASHCEVYLPKRTGQQLAVFVRHIHFRIQSARRGINGVRRPHHYPGKFLAGKFLQGDCGLHTNFHRRRIRLRHAHIHAQRIDPREVEQLFARGFRRN